MKYLFYISKFYSLTIIQPLIDFLDGTDDEYVILVSRKVKKKLKKENIWSGKQIITSVQEGKDFCPDFSLSPGNYVDFRLPGIKVEIFHGIGIEKPSHYEIRHFFDVYCTSGPVVTAKFHSLQKKYGYFLVRETGWPKMDSILNYPSENIRKKFDLPEDKKIILYAPTFSRKMQSAEALMDIIPKIAKEDELWLIKLHEFMDKQTADKYAKLSDSRIKLIEAHDITPYLHIADVMISDTSSVVYEFMALDKPVITYRTMSRSDKGINIQDSDELRPALDRCINNPGELSGTRKKQISEVNPNLDGKTAERVFSALENIIKNNELPKKRKPLNLFRKLRILYHEKFRRGHLK